MDAGWAALVGALGGSAITWLASEWRHLREERAEARRSRHGAYTALLTTSLAFASRAQALGNTKRFRSGLAEGVAVLAGQRKPLDPQELHDWFDKDMSRLNDAWSAVWAIGSQAAIDTGDELVTAASDVLEAAIADNPKRSKVVEAVAGVGWSTDQQANFDAALRRFSERRVAFVGLMRRESGEKPVEYALERARRDAAAGEAITDGSSSSPDR